MSRENSNYENKKAEDEALHGCVMISFLVIWPLSLFILLKFPDFANSLPWWVITIFLLFFPYFVGTRLLKLIIKSGTEIPGKDN